MANLSVYGAMGGTSLTEPVTFTGTGTLWNTNSPIFTITGAGNSVGTATVIDDTHATATITCGSTPGPYTVSDSFAGVSCTFTIATAFTYDITDASIYGHYVQVEGSPQLTSAGGRTCWNDPLDGCFRFRATCGQIDAFCFRAGGPIRLAIDGVNQDTTNSTLTVGSGIFAWVPWGTGLDLTAEHEYQVWWGGLSGASYMYGAQLRVFGGTGLNTAALPARKMVAGPGDSVGAGAGIGSGNVHFYDSTLCFWHDLAVQSSYQIANKSRGSQFLSSAGGIDSQSVAPWLANVYGVVPTASVIYIITAVADVLANYNGSQLTQFGSDCQTILTSYRANLPNAWIIFNHIHPHDPTSTTVDPYNVKIDAAVAAMADPKIKVSTVIYDLVKASGLVNYHPNVTDCVPWAAAIKQDIDALFFLNRSTLGDRAGSRQSQ